jgi:hypothetical protein
MSVLVETRPATEADVLRGAIAVLEEYGWIQGRLGDCAEGFCIMGAVRYAALTVAGDDMLGWFDVLEEAGLPQDAGFWNDQRGRTKAEVVALLKRAAHLAEEGADA